MLKVVNLKEFSPSLDIALATVDLAIENSKREGTTVIKVLHGYGSHGKGGVILLQLRKFLKQYKNQGKILDYFGGDEWNIFNKKTMFALNRDKNITYEYFNKSNPGITIIILK